MVKDIKKQEKTSRYLKSLDLNVANTNISHIKMWAKSKESYNTNQTLHKNNYNKNKKNPFFRRLKDDRSVGLA